MSLEKELLDLKTALFHKASFTSLGFISVLGHVALLLLFILRLSSRR
jgi:hypothetical protein